jgi:hypothetical protein
MKKTYYLVISYLHGGGYSFIGTFRSRAEAEAARFWKAPPQSDTRIEKTNQ